VFVQWLSYMLHMFCGASAGERCPCGAWVTPAFHVQRTKVDACRTLAVPASKSSSVVADVLPTHCKQTPNHDVNMLSLQTITSPDGFIE